MRRIRYTRNAISDFASIAFFLRDAGVDRATAGRITYSLRDKCRALSSLPGVLGRPRPEIREGLRSFPFRGYVIFFRYRDDLFEVVSIVDGRRDIEAQFESGPAED